MRLSPATVGNNVGASEGTLDAVDLRILGQELAGPNQANLKHPILVATTGSLSGLLSGTTEASQGLWVKMLGCTGRQGIRDGYAG